MPWTLSVTWPISSCPIHTATNNMTLVSVFLLIFLSMINNSRSTKCFTCEGMCATGRCNCHVGMCQGDYCYSERMPAEMPYAFKISKGCMKRPPRTHTGCDYDQVEHHVLCVCKGEFCNDEVMVPPSPVPYENAIRCKKCGHREPGCSNTCMGRWCYHDALRGVAGCGHGPPSLPFFYKGPELLGNARRHELCVTFTRGTALPRTHCICDREECNDGLVNRRHDVAGHRIRSLIAGTEDDRLPLKDCINCESSATEAGGVHGQCKGNVCRGHFCTYAAQRERLSGIASVTLIKQGCINVTDPTYVQKGCTQKWMSNKREEIHCACDSHFCNADLAMAHKSPATTLRIPSKLRFTFLTVTLLAFVTLRY